VYLFVISAGGGGCQLQPADGDTAGEDGGSAEDFSRAAAAVPGGGEVVS